MRFVFLAVAISFLPNPCKKSEDVPPPPPGLSSPDAGAKSPELTAEEKVVRELSTKMEPYVEISNEFTGEVKRNRRAYMDDRGVDPKKGPLPKPPGKIYLRDMKDPAPFIAKVTEAKPKLPNLPDLEMAGDAYVASLNALKPLLHDAGPYYDAETNKDDKGKKGRELHPKLLQAWSDFDKASSSLGDALDKYEDQITTKKLAILAKEPEKRFTMLQTRLLSDAKAVVKMAGDIKDPSELAMDKFIPKDDALEKTINDFKAYKTEPKPAPKDAAAAQRRDANTDKLIRVAEPFAKAAKELLRRKRDNVKYTQGEKNTIGANNAAAVEGSPGQVIKYYNDLIDASNSI